MAKLVFVFGTQGAGKSTVLHEIKGAKVLNVGDEMLKIFSKKFHIKERDEIRKVSLSKPEEMVKARLAVLKKAAMGPGKLLLIDTHASIKLGDSYLPGLSMEDLKVMKGATKAIIYIDADTKEILKRREKDKSRHREIDTEADVNQHKAINTALITSYSIYLEVPIYIVQNRDWGLNEARKRIEQIIGTIK